jgi:hypothetical protein
MNLTEEILPQIASAEAHLRAAIAEFEALKITANGAKVIPQISLNCVLNCGNAHIYSFFLSSLSSLESPSKSLKDNEFPKLSSSVSPTRKLRARDADADGFADFWAVYPKHINRKSALSKYAKITANGVAQMQLLNAANAYSAFCVSQGIEARYIKAPDVWLNKGCWEDELDLKPNGYARPADTRTPEQMKADWARYQEEHKL